MRFAVVGDPIEHSRSPAIHNAAFKHLDIVAEFVFMHVDADDFGRVVEELRAGELDGVSVTMPHKHNAFEAADRRSDTAERSGAVNTLIVEDGRLIGYNTDIAGVKYAMDAAGTDAGAPVLVLGYGGAASAALLAVEGAKIYLSGRDVKRAAEFVGRMGVDATVLPWGTPIQAATVINATPLGMAGESLPDGVVERAGVLIDMAYGVARTPAVALSIALGIPAVDGLTMLVGQAAEAFKLFTGQEAPTAVMEDAARQSLEMRGDFVPANFDVPTEFEGAGFRIEPLGPQHNERDHDAWMSSVDHIRKTPGFESSDWPAPMSLEKNLDDLTGHARDFENREGFTYAIREAIRDGDDVIGCLYIYPSKAPGHDAEARSWVRASRAKMDAVVWRAVLDWTDLKWPFENLLYASRETREQRTRNTDR